MKNPHDGRFKVLAEDHPELLLRLLGIIAPNTEIQIIDILRELQLDPVQIDHAYKLALPNGEWRLVHFEAITSWDGSRIGTLALYRFLLKRKLKLPIDSYVVFLAEKYVPKKLPEKLVYEEDDGTRIEVPYKVIRLWEIDPSIAFEPGGEALLPWVALMKGGLEQIERACERIEGFLSRREEAPYAPETMASALAGFASLRYDKDVLGDFLERMRKKMMLSTDLFKESWLYQDGVAEGKAEGRAQGEAEGRAQGKAEGKAEGRAEGDLEGQLKGLRSSIRMLFERRFPKAGPCPDLTHLDRLDRLNDVFARVYDAPTADEALALMRGNG